MATQTIAAPCIDRDLTGHVAVVVGATGDVGAALCWHFARRGAFVGVVDDRDSSDGSGPLVRQLRHDTFIVAPSVVDLGDASSVARGFRHVVARLGPVDVLICNAGGASGAAHCIAAVLPDMTHRQSGLVVTIASGCAGAARGNAQVIHVTGAVAVDHGGQHVRANVVYPIAARRTNADEIVDVVAHLTSEAGVGITNRLIPIGGKWSGGAADLIRRSPAGPGTQFALLDCRNG